MPESGRSASHLIRVCDERDLDEILSVINDAARSYEGVIPDACWHRPYMPRTQLLTEIAAGVQFWGCESDNKLLGVMGMQAVRDVTLIRHAYVKPAAQRSGIGSALLVHLLQNARRPVLVGTWAAAGWAITFYRGHRFELLSRPLTAATLRDYWTISDAQLQASVVLRLD